MRSELIGLHCENVNLTNPVKHWDAKYLVCYINRWGNCVGFISRVKKGYRWHDYLNLRNGIDENSDSAWDKLINSWQITEESV